MNCPPRGTRSKCWGRFRRRAGGAAGLCNRSELRSIRPSEGRASGCGTSLLILKTADAGAQETAKKFHLARPYEKSWCVKQPAPMDTFVKYCVFSAIVQVTLVWDVQPVL